MNILQLNGELKWPELTFEFRYTPKAQSHWYCCGTKIKPNLSIFWIDQGLVVIVPVDYSG